MWVRSAYKSRGPSGLHLSPVSVTQSDQEYFYSPFNGMLVYRRVTPSIKITVADLYTWAERGNVRIKCVVQEYNTISPARFDGSTLSRVECTHHEATKPQTIRETTSRIPLVNLLFYVHNHHSSLSYDYTIFPLRKYSYNIGNNYSRA